MNWSSGLMPMPLKAWMRSIACGLKYKIKSAVQDKIEKKGSSKKDHGAEGMHEAIQEITKAMGALKKYISGD